MEFSNIFLRILDYLLRNDNDKIDIIMRDQIVSRILCK